MSFHKADCAPSRSTVLDVIYADFWNFQASATLKELEKVAAIRLAAINILAKWAGGIFRV
jgi:hypothetical protein